MGSQSSDGKGPKAPFLIQTHLQLVTLHKGKITSLQGVSPGTQTTLKLRPMPSSTWPTQRNSKKFWRVFIFLPTSGLSGLGFCFFFLAGLLLICCSFWFCFYWLSLCANMCVSVSLSVSWAFLLPPFVLSYSSLLGFELLLSSSSLLCSGPCLYSN